MALAFMRKPANDPGRNQAPPPAPPPPPAYVSQARWAKPLPRSGPGARPNFIPRQSFLEYNWIDKDPDLEFACFAIQESGYTLEQIEKLTDDHGHKVSRWTLIAWMYGGTKRPHNSTVSTVMAAIGWHRPWVQR